VSVFLVLALALGWWWLRPRPRVLLIGIDGAEWTVLRPLLDAGRLPNLQRLRVKGVSSELLSLENLPPSAAIWTSLATGKIPDQHGVLAGGTNWRTPKAPGPSAHPVRTATALWNIVSAAGLRVVVVGWPATSPPETVHGAMVSDEYAAEGAGPVTAPPELFDRLRPLRVRPDHVPPAEILRFLRETQPPVGHPESAQRVWPLRVALAVDASHAAAARELWQIYRPDLLAVHFGGLDVVQHVFWEFMEPSAGPFSPEAADVARYRDVIPRYYAHLDGLIGDLCRLVGADTTVLVVSDHGFVPSQRCYRKGISAEHRRETVLLAIGPALRPGTTVSGASVLDVTPTVLHLQGLPVAADMDGHVLVDAIDPLVLARRPVTTIPSYEPRPPERPPGEERRLPRADACTDE
jgi:predicted AlkP superfamily phosphohydrolase/phosphomutase